MTRPASTKRAIASRRASQRGPATNWTPIGMSCGPNPAGRVRQGSCSSVQGRQNTGSPVASRPSGASSKAAGASTASSSDMATTNEAPMRFASSRAAS
jgi:hypothetical protein